MFAFPIPAPPGTPWWVNILFLLGGLAVLVVIIWQAVRYFRANPSDRRGDGSSGDGGGGGDGRYGDGDGPGDGPGDSGGGGGDGGGGD